MSGRKSFRDAMIDRVRELATQRFPSRAAFARALGIDPAQITRYYKDPGDDGFLDVGLTRLDDIERVLGVRWEVVQLPAASPYLADLPPEAGALARETIVAAGRLPVADLVALRRLVGLMLADAERAGRGK